MRKQCARCTNTRAPDGKVRASEMLSKTQTARIPQWAILAGTGAAGVARATRCRPRWPQAPTETQPCTAEHTQWRQGHRYGAGRAGGGFFLGLVACDATCQKVLQDQEGRWLFWGQGRHKRRGDRFGFRSRGQREDRLLWLSRAADII